MAHIGEIKERLTIRVMLRGDYEFATTFGWRETTNHIYTLVDAEENVFVWKTASVIGMDEEYANGDVAWHPVHIGDIIEMKGTVKEHSEYKDTPQTVLTRCKVTKILEKAPTQEEKEEAKRKEQMDTLGEGDIIYEMPYRQYKTAYDDCETLAGSYDGETGTVKVIIRKGRMKASGVRGKKFADYLFKNESRVRCIYAVSAENAWKRIRKEFGSEDGWVLDKVIPSGSRGWY